MVKGLKIKMKKMKLVLGFFVLLVLLITTIYAMSSSSFAKILNNSPPRDKDSRWVNTTYYTINESYNLTLFRRYGPYPLETVNITVNQSQLPAGMVFPSAGRLPSLDGYVNTTGNWIPTYCQGSPLPYKSYRFVICYNHSANPFPGCADTEWINISVRNKNRAPYFDTNNMFPCGPARVNAMENQQIRIPVIVQDLDKIECANETHSISLECGVTPTINNYNNCSLANFQNFTWNNGGTTGIGQINWTPSEADVGKTYTFTLNTQDDANATAQTQFQVCVNTIEGFGPYTSIGPCPNIACY